MTEQSPAETPAATTEPDTGEASQPATPDLSNEVEKWQTLAKKHEARAKENAKAAEELAALKQSQMSEAERATARMAELEREAQAARSEAVRFRIATRHGISDEDAELFLTATDEETLERQAKALADRNAAVTAASTAPGGPRPDLTQGAKDIPLNGDPIEARLKQALGIT